MREIIDPFDGVPPGEWGAWKNEISYGREVLVRKASLSDGRLVTHTKFLAATKEWSEILSIEIEEFYPTGAIRNWSSKLVQYVYLPKVDSIYIPLARGSLEYIPFVSEGIWRLTASKAKNQAVFYYTLDGDLTYIRLPFDKDKNLHLQLKDASIDSCIRDILFSNDFHDENNNSCERVKIIHKQLIAVGKSYLLIDVNRDDLQDVMLTMIKEKNGEFCVQWKVRFLQKIDMDGFLSIAQNFTADYRSLPQYMPIIFEVENNIW